MNAVSSIPEVGQIVRVRQRLYLVEGIVARPRPQDSTLVELSCIEDDAQGQELDVLWERELDASVLTGEEWARIAQRGFDPPDYFSAYLNTLRWNCVTSTDASLLQSPFRAGIRLDAYQLEPLRKALRLPRVNLFIADDVGLGKTIEAGLIARELLMRKKVREIVVACPPSMLLQWQEELEQRFGLLFEILDKDFIAQIRRERGFGVNPWTAHSRFLISHRLLIDEAYAGPLRNWLGTFRPGTLLILDEAHHAAPSSGQRYAIDSQITRAIQGLSPRFEHRLFLSATPHNGHSNSFTALLELLDPQRFCRGVKVVKRNLDDVMVRRLKDDLREIVGGFPKRHVVQVDISDLPADSPELRIAALLDQYRVLREERLTEESRRTQSASGLLITGLQQRLFSSIEAFAKTLAVHRKTVKKQWEQSPPAPASAASLDLLADSVGADDERATLSEEALAAEADAQMEAATAATIGPTNDQSSKALFDREQQLLDEMTELADKARFQPDGRTKKLIEWIRANQLKDGKHWTDLRVIIFTEYDDTKRYLLNQLNSIVAGSDGADERIAVYHGPTPAVERERIKKAFNADPSQHPVRILIATDAAREGLNLQAHCWNLFHFDVPWNPGRMEQRNGRIDRKLQPNNDVYCHYFFYTQRPEDRILKVLVEKTRRIQEELGSLSQVIESRLEKLMKNGIRRRDLPTLEREIRDADIEKDRRETMQDELEAARERQDGLREQIDRLRGMLNRSRQAVAFQEDHFRAAISCGLRIAGSEPLGARPGDGHGPTQYTFPAIDQRDGADPTWAATLDALRKPRDRSERLWEWRRNAPIRPVVFDDPGTVTDEVVHLHLEHPVVRRLLSRFVSQGFVHHDLSRACCQTNNAIPRVILLRRLALYGPGAARLHEEIIPVTARWRDSNRAEPLTPYARTAETETLRLLDDALMAPRDHRLNETIRRQLLESVTRDIQDLLPHLETRAGEYEQDARAALAKRADAEAEAMREILDLQQTHLLAKVSAHDKSLQLLLDFNEDERRQKEYDRRHWEARLSELPRERETEPERIRALYEVKARRVEPIGLVYLWPVTN
ncbi:MAG: DISARM system SNF2-like helicase DrmD [Bryobacterales bacterium]|nr:DISARM system SNF2-like helicase DrmD [Bryobacterales bacterium]